MLYLSKLNIDNPVNLDEQVNALSNLEVVNSSVDNNSEIISSVSSKAGIVQKNETSDVSKVTLTNRGVIQLNGDRSLGMYAGRGIVINDGTGKLNLGKNATGIYVIDDGFAINGSYIRNLGEINVDEGSTGIYFKNALSSTSGGVENIGKINSNGKNVTGIIFATDSSTKTLENRGEINLRGDRSVGIYATGSGIYNAKNYGIINIGDSVNLNSPGAGMYTDKNNVSLKNYGVIKSGQNSISMYGYSSEVSGEINIGKGSTGIYSKGGDIVLNPGSKIVLNAEDSTGVYVSGSAQNIVNNAVIQSLGNSSFGIINSGTGNSITSNTSNTVLGSDSVFIYSNDSTGNITNNTNLVSGGDNNYGIYVAGNIVNYGDMSFSNGIGNVGIYSIKGGTAKNMGTIDVGVSDENPHSSGDMSYSIGMAAGYTWSDLDKEKNLSERPEQSTGNLINNGIINIKGKGGIGVYATGKGSTFINSSGSVIKLASDGAIGVYLDNYAKGENHGIITTELKANGERPSEVVGLVLRKGSVFTNYGTIDINSDGGIAVFKASGGILKNYGIINVSRDAKISGIPAGNKPLTKRLEDIFIDPKNNQIKVNNKLVTISEVAPQGEKDELLHSDLGIYIDTLKKTNAITGLSFPEITGVSLIVGAEAAEQTNGKYIKVSNEIMDEYAETVSTSNIVDWKLYSGSLTWMASGSFGNLYLAKIPYTYFTRFENNSVQKIDTYNFLDGLEQRYGVEALGSREKELFNKLNKIGKNELLLFKQSVDEMMGHQYGNTQQRINSTGRMLDKEFSHLKKDWGNPSKQNNKIKVFGMRDEYKSETAGIIDYTSNSYGVAYVHEDEKIRMGNSTGWYAGAVTNKFKFRDIGKSNENQTMIKAGVFKTMSPRKDYNGSLQWTIGGDAFVGINDMKRRYLVVDEIFEAKSNYRSYGAALKTDLGYDIRMSERVHLRPYGGLKLEYGRFNNIKEDSGQIRLEVKGNDYFSVKPEAGMEFRYVQPLAVRTNLTLGLTAAYESELGKVGDVNNKGRVRYTTADWFKIRGEKDDRRGNGKFDLNIGVDNTRFGVTVNGGYDTKGKNVRGGIGFRAIY